jgi:ubiquitin-conjugating enzyme E2 Z
MSALALKRVTADIQNIKRSNLEKEHIYVSVNDDDVFNFQALIIGPETKDSPYQNGFYLFDINVPSNYPFSPPKVKFMTLDGKTRFNPNLYKCGKVCLSVLNTWSGPGWTSAHTLTSVLVVLQSLLHEHPIQNEPGYEKEDGVKSKNYNNVLAYQNINFATIELIKNPPEKFEVFKDIMIKYLVNNIEKYNTFINSYMELDGLVLKSGIYNMTVKTEFKLLQEKLMLLYSEYEELYKQDIKNDKKE